MSNPDTTKRSKRGRKRRTRPGTAVAYVRVSTEEQADGRAAQRDAIQVWADQAGVEIVEWFEDIGVSGAAALEDRPGLWDAIEHAERERASMFVIAKRDRLARDAMLAELLRRKLADLGVEIHSADGVGNGDTPEAQLLRTILNAIAQYERSLIRARTRAALAARKKRGLKGPGQLPYGMRVRSDGVTLEPDPEERVVVERIVSARATGETLQAIVDGLNTDRVPARGRRWHLATIQRILASSA